MTRQALKDLDAAKASAEAKVAELVKENKLLDVQWMAAEGRAAAAEARAAAAEARDSERGTPNKRNAVKKPASKSMVEARLLTMLVSQDVGVVVVV